MTESLRQAQTRISVKHGLATLWVSKRRAMKGNSWRDAALVSLIVVPREIRGRGVGAAAMADLCKWADLKGVALGLSPSPDHGSKKERLTRWYESLGFSFDTGYKIRNATMVRLPEETT